MPSFIAKSNKEWAEFIKGEGITDSVNHWSPSPRPLLNNLIGNRLFFFARTIPDGKRRVVGWGTVRAYVALSVEDAWTTFGHCNGADSLDTFLYLLNGNSSARTLGKATVIGHTIVDNVIWLDDPLEIERIGIHVASQVVRGRSITNEEEQILTGNHTKVVPAQARQRIIYCQRCQNEVPEGSRFCHHCGVAVTEPPTRPSDGIDNRPPIARISRAPLGVEHSRLKKIVVGLGIFIGAWFFGSLFVAQNVTTILWPIFAPEAQTYGDLPQWIGGMGTFINLGVSGLIAYFVVKQIWPNKSP